MTKKIDFIVFAAPRTGSNHLVSLLNSHPNCTCHGEIFRPLFKPSSKIDKALKKWDGGKARFIRPEKFISEIKSKSSKQTYSFGYKLFLNHFMLISSDVFLKVDKVIYLSRENMLARYSSMLTAKVSGQGALKSKDKPKNTKAIFVEEKFDRFVKKKYEEQITMEKLVAAFPKDKLMSIKYTDINHFGKQQAMLKVLGLQNDTKVELSSNLIKRNSDIITDRFSNKSEVLNYLERNPKYQHWVTE